MSQFLIGAGVALLSAALGFSAASLQQQIEKRRRHRALASIFLIDLRWLEGPLRTLYEDEHAGNNIVQLKDTVFDRAGADLLLFDVETVQALSLVYGLVSDLRTVFDEEQRRESELTMCFTIAFVPWRALRRTQLAARRPDWRRQVAVCRETLKRLPNLTLNCRDWTQRASIEKEHH
ncbi:MAG: hypothetical protein WAV20_00830 [Blastocatellia bacterium]